MFTVGRILAGLLTRHINVRALVKGCILTGLAGAVVLALDFGVWANLAAASLIGLAFAPVYPGMMSGTLGRVGREHSDSSVGMQAAAGSLGATGLTSLVGVLARSFSLEVVPILLIIFLLCLLGVYLLVEHKGPRDPLLSDLE
jgi:fucose permease